MIEILYFAWVRSHIGVESERLALPPDIRTVEELMRYLSQRSPGHAKAFADPSLVRAAINLDQVDPDATIRDGDEVAFFPPMTGGA